ncbi:arginine--tRNA ligase [Candidatus Woesearchaeota archaeon]|nr:arginine--tRNA ligase [Candidatus Woesearchaeota archaeon]
MNEFRNVVAEALSSVIGRPAEQLEPLISAPPEGMGDFAFQCFSLAKELKKSPAQIAGELAPKIRHLALDKVVASGGYLNFFVNRSMMAAQVLSTVGIEKSSYGSLNVKGRALIEHTSINPNASPHVGRARNGIIGDSVSRMLRFHGYDVEVHYFVNDVGKQVAMLVLACRGKAKVSFNDLLGEYVRINAELEGNPELEAQVFSLLKQLEDGDEGVKREFRNVVDICVKGQSRILSDLGMAFDHYDYESKYLWDKSTQEVLQRLEGTGRVFADEGGRRVLDLKGFDLPMEPPVFVLTRADGTSLYGLRDIAYNLEKNSRAGDRNIVVLGEDHKLYFRQVSAALSVLGERSPEVIHYSFILLPSGKMSTRSGNVVLLEDFMAQAVEKARAELVARGKHANIGRLSKVIGYGALKYHVIRVSPEKNVLFDWEKALSFEGESAPYIQYAHARICSILRKARHGQATGQSSPDYSLLRSDEEFQLVRLLAGFPDVAAKALLRPHLLANYLQGLADCFNSFYHQCPVISDDAHLMSARLSLCSAVRQVLETGLNLLGIDAPEEM